MLGCSPKPRTATGLSLYIVAEEPGENTFESTLDDETIHLIDPPVMTEPMLYSANFAQEPISGDYSVMIRFAEPSSTEFSEVTQNAVGKRLAILVSGQVISAPSVNEPIFHESVTISGDFTAEEAYEIAQKILPK